MHPTNARRFQIALFVALALLLSGAAFGIGSETTILIEPGTEQTLISLGSFTAASYEQPQFGDVVPVGNGFLYLPNAEFWAVGHDILIIEVNHRGEGTVSHRVILTTSNLSFENNTVYTTQTQHPDIPGEPWTLQNVNIVPGLVYPNAFEMFVDLNNPATPKMIVDDDNEAGHQQTSEHVVNVTVDDLDLPNPDLSLDNSVTFYRLFQGSTLIAAIEAHFDLQHDVWQVRPVRGDGQSNIQYTDVPPGFYEVKLVRWGTAGNSGADFYINNQLIGTLTGLPFLTVGVMSYELMLEQTEEHDGLIMRFENPVVVTGTEHVGSGTRLAYSTFGSDPSNIQSVTTEWDLVEGDEYMNLSPQSLAGPGNQIDIDLEAIPDWEHAFLRQDFVAAPLSHYKARFWMDPTFLNLPEGIVLHLFYGCRDAAASQCADLRLKLHRVNNQLHVKLHVWEDDGTLHTISQPITETPHWIELRYETSAASHVSTGWAELWVNGVSAGSVETLDNHDSKIEKVRFGTYLTMPQVTGTLSLDEIYTWHD